MDRRATITVPRLAPITSKCCGRILLRIDNGFGRNIIQFSLDRNQLIANLRGILFSGILHRQLVNTQGT